MAISDELRKLVDPNNECCCEHCLSNKCKEWAKKKEFIITSETNTYASYSYVGLDVLNGGFIKEFEADTEPEAIFKATCDFLEQYKPYEPEPVFEWQWAYITNSLLRWHITNYMTEEEFKTWKCGANSSLEYKRLDFTKR